MTEKEKQRELSKREAMEAVARALGQIKYGEIIIKVRLMLKSSAGRPKLRRMMV